MGIPLLKNMRDPILAIIRFGFRMEITVGILLNVAKMTNLLDKENHA